MVARLSDPAKLTVAICDIQRAASPPMRRLRDNFERRHRNLAADQARETRPGLKILFITGYAENVAIAKGFLQPGMEMITKPFDLDNLSQRIREMVLGKHRCRVKHQCRLREGGDP
jgi:CheY-like chemotaxis protein